jgi:hypothetical protein
MAVSLKDQVMAELVGLVHGDLRRERRKMFVTRVTVTDSRGDEVARGHSSDASAHGLALRLDNPVTANGRYMATMENPKTRRKYSVDGTAIRTGGVASDGRHIVGLLLDDQFDIRAN